MNYARLRAIETGKWIARSANTGISCFIDPNGTVINPQPWDTAAAIKLNVPVFSSSKETFFVRQGDILSRVMLILALLLIAGNIILWVLKKFFKKDYTILRSGNG
jgi:apolipoprotein N-acyltransferase